MREAVALSLVGAVCAVLGGVIFWAVHGGSTLTRSIAYGCWFAAALTIVLAVVSGQKLIWRRTNLPVPEGWVLYSSAVALTVVGAVVDAIGS
jgi:Na+-translocating ferredoxin:NAD+ oxidoreductase RnfA subunit